MWIHYQDPHGPYIPPEPFSKKFFNPDEKSKELPLNKYLSGKGGIPSYQILPDSRDYHHYVSQYDGEISYWDEHFRHLIDAMKNLGAYEDSLIIFTSDHGEDLGEHGYYFSHGENLYNSLLHVPLMIKYGNKLIGQKSYPVQHMDIVPTVLEFIGSKPNAFYRGRNLLKNIFGKREIYAEMVSPLVAKEQKLSLIYDDLKLIFTHGKQSYELYNISKDFYEEHNLIRNPQYSEKIQRMASRLWRIIREDFLNLTPSTETEELSPAEKEKLKSLGYVR